MIVILSVCRSRGECYGYSTGGRLGEEEIMLFTFGLIDKFLDRTSCGTSGENGIYLFLCGLEGYWFIVVRDYFVIIVNSKMISMYIKYYVWGVVIVVITFVARTVCIGIVVVVVIPPTVVIITIITGGKIEGVVVQGVHVISLLCNNSTIAVKYNTICIWCRVTQQLYNNIIQLTAYNKPEKGPGWNVDVYPQ